MNLLFPRLKRELLPGMILVSAIGFLVGGLYGAVHDSVTFRISNEYFQRLKFDQFRWADLGLPDPLFAAQIGFIAGGAVGLIAGWFIARTAVTRIPVGSFFQSVTRAFLIVFCTALSAVAVTFAAGSATTWDLSGWTPLCDTLGVTRPREFVQVAFIHNASYLGGFVGLFVAIVGLRLQRKPPAATRAL